MRRVLIRPGFSSRSERVIGFAVLRTGVLLVLLFVAQFGAYLHWLGHFKAVHEGGPVPEQVCGVCLVYAQGSAALPSTSGLVLPPPMLHTEDVPAPLLPNRKRDFFAYLSQAPPVLS